MVLKGSSLCVKSSSNSIRALPRVFNRVILGVKTCEVFLCFQAIIFKWLLCIIFSFSATREFHTEYEPFNHPFSLVQITVKTSRPLFSLLQLEVSLEHRLVVGGELFHGGGGTLGLFGWGCASGTLEPSAYTYTRAAQPPPAPTSILSGCFSETTEVTSKVQPKQNRFPFFIFLSGNSQFP